MKVNKEYIIALVALLSVFAMIGGGYQFYYKERLAQYQQNIIDEERFTHALDKLENHFQSCPPEDLISAVSGEINPMVEELQRRASFYHINDLRAIQPIPEDKMLGFYYREEFERVFNEFRQEQLRTYPNFWYPPDTTFGAPRPEAFTGVVVQRQDVRVALQKIAFGLSMVRLLMDSKAIYATDIQLWQPRREGIYTDYTVGLAFSIMTKDLVEFVDRLRVGEVLGQQRYVTINALSIQNRYMRLHYEPPVEVKMLLTFSQASLDEPAAPQLGAAPAASAFGFGAATSPEDAMAAFRLRLGSRDDDDDDPRRRFDDEPQTGWARFKRWMGKYFWPF